ncbi:hypothetical protein [Caballeronia grimmiae]|uniref:hypothetical protein n=1 Tax=Caballeronia grimmiae TaxID=1071679 RepID=UPI0038BAB0CD
MITDIHPVAENPLIRDYEAAIASCRRDFNIANNDKTLFGATPGAFQGNASGPQGWRPSAYDIFNTWAASVLKQLVVLKDSGKLAPTLATQESFDAWHKALIGSLQEHWKQHAHPDFRLSKRQAHKLVNLFVKWLRIKVPADVRPLLEKHAHVTLNGPTLARISELLGENELGFPLDQDFTGWYADVQDRLRDFTHTHGGSPVLVDIWCRAAALGDPDEDA